MGSGRTELARVLFGIDERFAGTVNFDALATSLALLFVDIGQPEAHLYRIGLAAWGIGGAAAALMNDPERS